MNFFKSSLCFLLLFVFFFTATWNIFENSRTFYLPAYEFQSIEKGDSNERIFALTGLSGEAAKELTKKGDFETIKKLNTLYFKKPQVKKNYIFFPVTAEEKNVRWITPLAPLKDGDILITLNTYTIPWRHGHAAIVTDSKHGEILEHRAIGRTSCISYAKNWGGYPSFAVLRYEDEKTSAEAAKYAKEALVDVPYSIFAGIIKKDKSDEEKITSSNCSHIVWQAFKKAGADIDSDKGFIVTPMDILMCDKLKVVQLFGMNTEYFKDRISER